MTANSDFIAVEASTHASPRKKTIFADAVLLDIEGTISPLSFVRDVLFPYSRERLTAFVTSHRHDPIVAAALEQASALAGGADPVAALLDWHDSDTKAQPLKIIQGLIWDSGFRSGAFRSPIFPDALAAVQRWHSDGVPLFVYSSGSVQAQLLFFEFSVAGDMRPLFSAHFDTSIGPKVDAQSYLAIAEVTGVQPARIAFFSDSSQELAAADTAGLQTAHVLKDGTPPDPNFAAVDEFDDVELVTSPAL